MGQTYLGEKVEGHRQADFWPFSSLVKDRGDRGGSGYKRQTEHRRPQVLSSDRKCIPCLAGLVKSLLWGQPSLRTLHYSPVLAADPMDVLTSKVTAMLIPSWALTAPEDRPSASFKKRPSLHGEARTWGPLASKTKQNKNTKQTVSCPQLQDGPCHSSLVREGPLGPGFCALSKDKGQS